MILKTTDGYITSFTKRIHEHSQSAELILNLSDHEKDAKDFTPDELNEMKQILSAKVVR